MATQLDRDGRTVLYEASTSLKLKVEKIVLPVDNALTQRIGIISGFIIMNLRQARAEGIKGADLIKRLAPFLLADALFVVIFVFWLVTNLP